MKKYIKGKYKRSIFESNNGYVIGNIKIKETNEELLVDYTNKEITFTGYFADLNLNDDYILYGDVVEHYKYGIQYQVKEYQRIMPEDKDGIVEFLSSDLFPGVGEKLAIRIVDTLGKQTLDKILEDRDVLKEVPKITEKKINVIYNTLTKYEESHKIVVYLTELGFNMKDALNIYNKYKTNTIPILENNIFDIIDDVDDISFLKIDEIALKLNFLNDDIRRIKACIVYIMKMLTYKNGDTYLMYDDIKRETLNYLKFYISDEDFLLFLDELRFDTKIVLENNEYYLKEIYESEITIVNKIKILLDKEKTKYKNIEDRIRDLEEFNNIKYNSDQKDAIKRSLENNILIINGGPGTGKTTIIKAIVDLYINLNGKNASDFIALLAPTGRASKRMSEVTNLPATTIHRFLRWDKDTNTFNINEYQKNNSELVIIDEVSMIDVNLLANLFKGLTDNIKLVLVGDYNQLPSVGPGNVLKDIIESDIIDKINLNRLYRQSNDSYINKLAIEIKNNELTDYLKTKDDYAFLKCSQESIPRNLSDLCLKLKEKNYNYQDVQIMAPMYIGLNGIDNLNKELQKVFNPASKDKEEITFGNVIFRENDKILQLVNMPDENVFNGDLGYIKYIIKASESESKKNEIYVDYDGLIVKYLPNDFIKIKHGFIISIHKAQGSEFNFVILPICKQYSRMLYRKLIYTAITRAKKKLIIIGDNEAFRYGVSNNNEKLRNTSLKNRLINMYKN